MSRAQPKILMVIVIAFHAMTGCTSSSLCESMICAPQDAGVLDQSVQDAACSSTAYEFDSQRACILGDATLPVCFLGPGGGKGSVTGCIIAPDGSIYWRWEGNDQTPYSEVLGWRFRVSSGGSNVATDGSLLTSEQVAACDRILIPGLPNCSACDDLGCG